MPRSLLSACVALLLAAALPAAAQVAYLPSTGAGDVRVPVTSMRQAKVAGTTLQKYDFSCGSAAIATLLTHHYGYPVTEEAVFAQMYREGEQKKIQQEGFSLLDMKRYLAAHGFAADGFEQPLDKLVEARVPAIALIDDNGYHHFVVIKGIEDDRVLIGDPAQGTRAMSRKAFEVRWQNRLLFVVHNRMEQARFNVAADWRASPRAPFFNGVHREGLSGTLPRNGPGDF